MNTTTTTQKNPTPTVLTDFIKEKYKEALENIIANIKANTVRSINNFIAHGEKYKGLPKSIIPLESDIQTGFEHIVEQIKNGQHLLSDDTLVIPYGRPLIVGQTFSTEYFEKELKPMPGKYLPGIVIALPPNHLNALEDVVHHLETYLEALWEKENFGDKIKVQF